MAGNKPLSWKWKLLIGMVLLVLFGTGFLFSDYGNNMIIAWIKKDFDQTPDNQKATHEGANWYLSLAWFQGNICLRTKVAMDMYLDFLAIKKGKHGDFFKTADDWGPQWNGQFFDSKKKIGWGPLHERAPEAYYEYLVLYDIEGSKQMTTFKALNYAKLFVDIYPYIREDSDGNPHPKFYKYWSIIKKRMIDTRFLRTGYPEVPPKPDGFEGPLKE